MEPVEPVTLGPGQRTSLRLQASSRDIGVHSVTLVTTDADRRTARQHRPLQRAHQPRQHGDLGDHGDRRALLLLAIVVRLYRRIRRRKTTHGPLLPRGAHATAPARS